MKYLPAAVKNMLMGKFLNMFLQSDIGPGWLPIMLHYFS